MKRRKNLFLLLLTIVTSTSSIAETISRTSPDSVIAYTIYAEARGEGQRGMCLVASVIKNRSVERKMSLTSVCLQRKQFSCWNGVNSPVVSPKNELDRQAWNYSKILARDLISGRFRSFTTANHYYNPSKCAPSWGPKLKDSFVYRRHRFGRL